VSEIATQTLFRSRILCPAVAIVAVPNASKRTQWAAQQAKREGLATGFPDLICLWKGPGVAAIEFKSEKGKLSDNQAEWIERLIDMGIPCIVSRDADEAVEWLRELGAPFIGRVG
jgi:ABC-type Fe3+-hydroxamate transport system substrate-binding protein